MPAPPNTALLSECRAAWAAWQRLAASRSGAGLIFGWALAEAIVWPIIPDFLLFPLAAGAGRRFFWLLLSAAVGSAVGGTLLYLYASGQPVPALAILDRLPFVTDRQVEQVRTTLAARGVAAFLDQPWTGISFKVWAILGGAQGLDPWLAIPTFVAARTARMSIFAAIAAAAGARLRGFLSDFSLFLAAIYVVLFLYGWWEVLQ